MCAIVEGSQTGYVEVKWIGESNVIIELGATNKIYCISRVSRKSPEGHSTKNFLIMDERSYINLGLLKIRTNQNVRRNRKKIIDRHVCFCVERE